MSQKRDNKAGDTQASESPSTSAEPQVYKPAADDAAAMPKEIGGREGPEPTRFGDWERNGRCIDF